MPQPLQELWHGQVSQVCDFELRLVTAQLPLDHRFKVSIKRGGTSNYDHVFRAGLEEHSRLQSFCRLEPLPDTCKVRIKLGMVRLLLGSTAENNGNAVKVFLVRTQE